MITYPVDPSYERALDSDLKAMWKKFYLLFPRDTKFDNKQVGLMSSH